ncbi:hypothetical protein Vretimale_11178 [Volvox reticuliferus]|uniref:Uncharacterized protein n=1 Tax=Volvox reticuliferus TaxID=1737510 RepID=A0A8J4LRS4_9CHLO|nr:hypothetical protein Vretimale_11178 [Volvox reticuliferus]
MSRFELARKLQATCGVLRSFLGPHKALKCIIDSTSDSRNCLVGTVQAFLLAADGDPTTTTLLLEALEGQAPSAADSPGSCPGPGSGATWLAVFCGQLLGHILDLVEVQGVPYECVRAGVLEAVTECCEAVRECAIELPMVAERCYEQDLMSYHEAVSLLMMGADAASGVVHNLERGQAETQADAKKPWVGPTYHPQSLLPPLQSPQPPQQMIGMSSATAAAPSDCTVGKIQLSPSPPPSQHQRLSSRQRAEQGQAQEQLPEQVSQLQVDDTGKIRDGAHDAGSTPLAGPDRGTVLGDFGGLTLEAEAELAALEEEASWFFNDGELQAEREARAQRRLLQQLATGLTAAGVSAPEMRSISRAPAPAHGDPRDTSGGFWTTTGGSGGLAAAASRSVMKWVATGQRHGDVGGGSSSKRGGGRRDGVGGHDERDEFGWFEDATVDSDTERADAVAGTRDPQPKAHAQASGSSHHPSTLKAAPVDDDDDDFGWFESYDLNAHHSLGPEPARGSSTGAHKRQDTGPATRPAAAGTRARAEEGTAAGLTVGHDGLIVPESPPTAELRNPVLLPGAKNGGVGRSEAADVAAAAGLSGLQTGSLRDPKVWSSGRRGYTNVAPEKGSSYNRRGREGLIGGGRRMGEGTERGLSEGGLAFEAEAEAELAALEEEASWFFNDGELQAEREARAQRRLLQQLATGLTAAGSGRHQGDGSNGEGRRQGGGAFLVQGMSRGAPNDVEEDVDLAGIKNTSPPDKGGNRHLNCVTAAPDPSPPPPPPPLLPVPVPTAPTYVLDSTCSRIELKGQGVLSSGTDNHGGRGSGMSSSEITAARHGLSPLSRLVCAAAQGLSHGRILEMQLAAAAVLLLLEPLIRREPGDARPPLAAEMTSAITATVKKDVNAISTQIRHAAASLQFDRCVLTVEMMGRSAVAAAAMRGVVVPLATLSAAQAALAAEFFMAAPSPPPLSLQPMTSSPSAAHTSISTSGAPKFTTVFFQGALQMDRAVYGPLVITDAAGLVTAASDVRVEAFASHLLEALKPHDVQLLLASGHIPDAISAALHQLSGGAMLALGGIGLHAIRAAATCVGVVPAVSLSSLNSGRNVATHVAVELIQGGLGLGDYRPNAGRRHTEAAMLMRIMKAPEIHLGTTGGGGGDVSVAPVPVLRPGWVTVVLPHALASQLEVQGIGFRVRCRAVPR